MADLNTVGHDYNFAQNTPISGQTDYHRYQPIAYPGMLSGMGSNLVLPYTNDVATQDTYTVAAPAVVDASTEYKVTVNGVTVSFTTDATPTDVELATGLYNAMRMDAEFLRYVDASLSTATITLTARGVGVKLNVSVNSADTTNDLTLTNTVSPSTSNSIPFGRFVGRKASYKIDAREGVSQASLIDHATDYTDIFGPTLVTHHTERVGIASKAVEGYNFGDTINVIEDTGTLKGVWVECVETDIAVGDAAYIAIAAGNEGKLTKTATGNVDISTKARIVTGSHPTVGNRYIALITWKR